MAGGPSGGADLAHVTLFAANTAEADRSFVGDITLVDLEVFRPDGSIQVVEEVAVDQLVDVTVP